MNLKNVTSAFLLGNDFEYILFKAAIFFAESGLNTWFISPVAFDKVPDNIEPPDREILQLITFVYLKDYKDLITHLNGIHLWHKVPNFIILSGFHVYSNLYNSEYKSLVTALIATTLLDSAAVCARKTQVGASIMVVTPAPPDNFQCRLQVLLDMYFPHLIRKTDDDKVVLESIINYFMNK